MTNTTDHIAITTNMVLVERYRIETFLGSGNMGEVYRAVDLEQDRLVAIKRIHPHLMMDKDAIQRFQREAKALSRLNHPGIVRFHDFCVTDGIYFLVLNYLDGQTLEEKLAEAREKQKPLPLEETRTIVLQLCETLAYAHKRHVVHRDLKPANVMITPQGHAVLMDFGIAKLLDGDNLTGDGLSPGTPAYMSPEIIRGRAVDPRSDIYTLGIILYEMLANRRPFQATGRYDTLHSHLFDAVPDIHQFNSQLPTALVAIIERALAKEPDKRYHSIEQLAEALQEVEIISTDERLLLAPALLPDADVEGAVSSNGQAKENIPPTEVSSFAPLFASGPELMPTSPPAPDSLVAPKTNPRRPSFLSLLPWIIILCLLGMVGVWGMINQTNNSVVTATPESPSFGLTLTASRPTVTMMLNPAVEEQTSPTPTNTVSPTLGMTLPDSSTRSSAVMPNSPTPAISSTAPSAPGSTSIPTTTPLTTPTFIVVTSLPDPTEPPRPTSEPPTPTKPKPDPTATLAPLPPTATAKPQVEPTPTRKEQK
ncbi:MAG: protein kinase [Chloroflexi bacterium]|nr:protein kinase [Chloroflexota bacterium]MBP8054342.1 protein kinase [Chloroflexota bacterium]